VVELHRQGGTIQGLARQLQIHRHTVRKFIQAPSFREDQRVPPTRSAIDAYRPSLQERGQAGCRSTEQVWRELQQQGFPGSWTSRNS
jgi:transposase